MFKDRCEIYIYIYLLLIISDGVYQKTKETEMSVERDTVGDGT